MCVNQPVRGPGDLRHDLERRRLERLERLEGVKVTICGSQVSQRPLDPIRWVKHRVPLLHHGTAFCRNVLSTGISKTALSLLAQSIVG